MNRFLKLWPLAGLTLFACMDAHPQDLAITNARIIVGNGTVINQGSIVVKGGRIVSVGQGKPSSGGARAIDVKGMTIMPGFIDAHRHIINGNPQQWLKDQAAVRMQEFLDAGYTTLLAGSGPAEEELELAKRIDSGALKGPQVIPAGAVNLAKLSPDEGRAEVRRLKGLGVKFIGEEIVSPKPVPHELEVLRAINDESKKNGALVMVHAVSPEAMLASVDAGVPLLVHTPHYGWLTEEDGRKVASAGVLVASCVGFGVPVFGVFAEDNKPRFRDGRPWPESILAGEGRGREAGYKVVNARTLWDAGVVYGFGTDTNYLPKSGLAHELKALALMFSTRDLVKLMGPNTAAFVQMSNEIGTLEQGKLADIVVLDGNPLDGYWNMLNVRMVVKGGVVMLDKR